MGATVEITPELMAGFLDEAAEHLEALNAHLLAFETRAESGPITFEKDEDREQMTGMFRAAHSLKGLTATFGFTDLNRLTHIMETLFDEARGQKRTFDLPTLNILLEAVGSLEKMVAQLSDPSAEQVDVAAAIGGLEAVLRGESAPAAPAPATAPVPPVAATPVAAPTRRPSLVVLDDPELRTLFIETTEEGIEELTQKLLKLEANTTEEMLNDVYRVAHTLKGACGAAGLDDVQRLTHQMETAFDGLRSGRLALSDTLMAGFFQVADRVREVVQAIRRNQYIPWTPENVDALNSLLGGAPVPAAMPSAPPPPTTPTAEIAGDMTGYRIVVTWDANDADRDLNAFVVFNRIKSIGDVVSVHPDLEAESVEVGTTLEVILRTEEATSLQADSIRQALETFKAKSVTVTVLESAAAEPAASDGAPSAAAAAPTATSDAAPAARPLAAGPTAAAPGARPAAAAGHDTIRVDVERLDQLMNLGGELVINRARFQQLEREFRDVFAGKEYGYASEAFSTRLEHLAEVSRALSQRATDKAADELAQISTQLITDFHLVREHAAGVNRARSSVHSLSEAVGTLDRIAENLQKQIMETRMVPVGPLFNRFRRVVRDIAKDLGKKIELDIHGENTELDKRMIDELSDPLTHIIRNSADHGIETLDERTATGKPAVSVLALEAYRQGTSICIEVRDDGRGINVDAIRKKLVEREIASPAQIEQMSERDLIQYIFHPGFSTAKQVSDLSGRGMGMDIVTTKIAKLNGTVEVDSRRGQGTTVTIKLPLTLAIIGSMLTRIGEATYAIPLDSVAEILTVERDEVHMVRRQRVVQVRGTVVPILFLEDAMTLNSSRLRTASRERDEWTLVVLEEQNQRLGLVVDEMIGQEEVVIKSLAENFRNLAGFVGATIMGDGRVSLILDAAYLFNQTPPTDERSANGSSEAATTDAHASRPRESVHAEQE